MYHLNPKANVNGTSFHGTTIEVAPGLLLDRLGKAHYEDLDGKVNLEWQFESDEGEVFTLYDYKEGKLDALKPIEFHIGSRSENRDLEGDFKEWLQEKLSS
jgi:hypothetical protein